MMIPLWVLVLVVSVLLVIVAGVVGWSFGTKPGGGFIEWDDRPLLAMVFAMPTAFFVVIVFAIWGWMR